MERPMISLTSAIALTDSSEWSCGEENKEEAGCTVVSRNGF